jgi:F0F1-type ATP synthase membrane subunit c/vacuolar-type H+-ATPase subunit K
MGAFTMIGAGFAAALCVMVAAKAGAEMITQKPELSIWSLLFIALGEGLAIYGLIITILMISK